MNQEDSSIKTSELIEPLQKVVSIFTDAVSEKTVERIAGTLPDFDAQSKKTSYELAAIQNQIESLAASEDLLKNANDTSRLLGKQFYDERIIQPMVRGLFPIVDFTSEAKKKLEENLPRYELALNQLDALRTQLQQFLAGYGIESYCHERGKTFDPKRMKPLKCEITNDSSLSGLVAESLQCGFKMCERILRLETVSLYKFEHQKLDIVA